MLTVNKQCCTQDGCLLLFLDKNPLFMKKECKSLSFTH